MPDPFLSVILISWNQSGFVTEAVRSVTSSALSDLELICVDDGSTDGTPALLRELARDDPRIELVALGHSGRPGVARNAGLARARGEFVCFLDGDDFFVNDRPAALNLLHSRHAEIDVSFSDYSDWTDGTPRGSATARLADTDLSARLRALAVGELELPTSAAFEIPPEALIAFLLSETFIINTDTVCIRRNLIEARGVRFAEHANVGEDNPFWLRCIRGSRVAYLDRVHAFWRKRPGSITATRTVQSQRTLTASIEEQLRFAQECLGAADLKRARHRLLMERREIGILQERDGHWIAATGTHLWGAMRYGSINLAMTAAKTLARAALRRPQKVA